MIKNFEAKTEYIEAYDVHVHNYLTYAEIQQIVDSLKELDCTWSDRNQNIDMLILYHATDCDMEELTNIGHDALNQSGMIDAVKGCIKNLNLLYKAIKYTESIERALTQIVRVLPDHLDDILKVMSMNEGKSSDE